MDLLARREHGHRELRDKLLQRGFEADLVEQVVAELAAEGLQSDSRFAEAYVRQRRERGYGPLRIRQELQQRGIADALIAASMAGCEGDWPELARQARRKRFGAQPPASLHERARQTRFLQYRGFSGADIRRALDHELTDD